MALHAIKRTFILNLLIHKGISVRLISIKFGHLSFILSRFRFEFIWAYLIDKDCWFLVCVRRL